MAIYSLHIQVASRKQGRSAVAMAAYRSGEKLFCEYDGIEHDYTRKQWVEHTEIFLPENAPEDFKDREKFWNSVEQNEGVDGRLCREFEVALPIELSMEQQKELVKDFCTELVKQGMCVDACIHNPPQRDDLKRPLDKKGQVTTDPEQMIFNNPHAHILTTIRPLDEKGKWAYKTEKEYLCIKDGEEKGFIAEEFRLAKTEGWKKQYSYRNEQGKKVWLTSEAGKKRGLEKINKSPKSTRFGRENPITKQWNSVEQAVEWRKLWADVANNTLEKYNIDAKIDHRSYAEQGLDLLPTQHLGPEATAIKRRAERLTKEGVPKEQITFSYLDGINQQIKKYNALLIKLKTEFEEAVQKAKGVVQDISQRLDALRNRISGKKLASREMKKHLLKIQSDMTMQKERISRYEEEISKINNANSNSDNLISNLQHNLKECSPINLSKKSEIKKQIAIEQKKIVTREDIKKSVSEKYSIYSQEELESAKTNLQDLKEQVQIKENQLSSLNKETDLLVSECRSLEEEYREHFPEPLQEISKKHTRIM